MNEIVFMLVVFFTGSPIGSLLEREYTDKGECMQRAAEIEYVAQVNKNPAKAVCVARDKSKKEIAL